MLKLIENTEARNMVVKAFELAATKKSGRPGSKKTLKVFIPYRDGENTKHIIYGTQFTIIETVASPIYSNTKSILRNEPAMVRYYGRNGVLVHEELAA